MAVVLTAAAVSAAPRGRPGLACALQPGMFTMIMVQGIPTRGKMLPRRSTTQFEC